MLWRSYESLVKTARSHVTFLLCTKTCPNTPDVFFPLLSFGRAKYVWLTRPWEILLFFDRFCVRCLNVGSSNQIAISGNEHKQHLNITCSKCTLDLKKTMEASKSTAIVPERPCLLLMRLYRWQYPGSQVN